MRIGFPALLTALFCAALGFAQPPEIMWTRAYGASGIDDAYGVCAVSDGGFLTVGRTRSFGPQFDVYAVRVNAVGDTLWTRTYGGAAYDHASAVREVPGGGFLLAGYTETNGVGNADLYVLRLAGNGDTLWTRTYGSGGSDYCYALVTTPDGGFALAGSIFVQGASLDAVLIKADAQGNLEWQRTYGGSNVDEAFSLQRTADGGYLLGGRSVPAGSGYPDMYAVRTNSAGDTLWTRRVGTGDWEECVGAFETADGGHILGGWRQAQSGSNSDFYAVKLAADGQQEWSRTVGGPQLDRATTLQQATDGGWILAGYTASAGAGAFDYYFVKLQSNGDTAWTATAGGAGDDFLRALAVTNDGGYIAAGSSSTGGFGSADVWLVRLPGYAGIAGYVRDSVTGNPLPDVWVGAIDQPNLARSDNTGYFVLTLPPDAVYDLITYGQCVARDTVFAIPVYVDSLTLQDLDLEIPQIQIPQTSINIMAYNHTVAAETLFIRNTGLGILDYAITVNTFLPADDWLAVEPAAGSVQPGELVAVAVQLTADTTDDGVYDLYGVLTVRSNSCPDSAVRIDVLASILDANDLSLPLPADHALSAYPNPFNAAASLAFTLPRAGHAVLVVYDLTGREVRRLVDARLAAGVHRVELNGSDLPSGLYVAHLRTESAALSRKLMLLK